MEAKTLYFPVCLLRDFEENEQYTAKKILKYCHDTIRAKKGEKEATKTLNQIIDFDVKYSLDPKNAMTFFNADFIKNLASGYEYEYMDKCVFLFVCAVNSILFKKDYFLTNWKIIQARANGYFTYNDKNILNSYSKRFNSQSSIYFREKLIELSRELCGVGVLSRANLRGFYVYKISDLVEDRLGRVEEERILKIEKDKIKKEAKKLYDNSQIKKSQKRLKPETKIVMIQTYFDNSGFNEMKADNKILDYLENKGVDLGSCESVIKEAKIYASNIAK